MIEFVRPEPVDYLVVGHLTEDLTSSGPRLGGTAAFSALTARALGLRVGVVSALSDETLLDALDGILVVKIPSPHNTTYENIYNKNGRVQILHHQAVPILLENVPDIWRSASIVHLAPVARELGEDWTRTPGDHFSSSLIGITPQGWMRNWDDEGHVRPSTWDSAEALLPQAGAVVISREDVLGDDELIESMAHQTRVLVVTEGSAGAVLYWNGDRRRFQAPEIKEMDATGAGDIFAAAFFVRLHATHDPWAAARFATQLAARSVAREGLNGIPTQAEIQECLMEVI